MDKTFIKFLILLFFLYFICQKQSIESYIQININNTQTACDDSSESCMISYRGDLGFHCTEPSDLEKIGYDISPHESSDLLSDSFNVTVNGCSAGYEEVSPGSAQATVCSSTGTPYTLSGCQAKCTPPSLSESIVDPENPQARIFNDYPDYMSMDGSSPEEFGNAPRLGGTWIPIGNPVTRQGDDVEDGQESSRIYKILGNNFKCSTIGSSRVEIGDNVCYDLNSNGRIVNSTSCERNEQNNYLSYPDGLSYGTGISGDTLTGYGNNYFDYSRTDHLSEEDPKPEREVMAYCPGPGAEYILFGCESNCLSRNSQSEPYPRETETIFIKDETTGGMTEITSGSDPYNEGDPAFLNPNPSHFNPNITCSSGYTASDHDGVHSDPTIQPEPCLHKQGHMNYAPSSCFPQCNSDEGGEECINLSFNLNKSQYDWLNQLDKQTEVDGYKDNIPTFFINSVVNATPELLDELKNSLYYYRSFSPDGNPDNEIKTIETQFKCRSGSESDGPIENQTVCELLN
jgi:hypothetical protein